MTLRLALVIDGDAKGAASATQATAKGIDDLGKKVDGLNTKLGEVGKQRPAGTDIWGRTAADIEKASTASGTLAGNIKEVGDKSSAAAPNIVAVGTAAGGIEGGVAKATGALRNLAIGFTAGLGVGVFTAAMDMAIGKAIDFATRIFSDTPRIQDDLKSHASLVRDIRDAYGEAKGAASSYGNNSKNLLTFNAQQDVKRLGGDLEDQAPKNPDRLFPPNNAFFSLDDPAGPFRDAVEQLKLANTEVIKFRDEVARIAATLPPDSPFRKLAEDALKATEAAAKTQEEYRRAQDLLKGVQGDADAAATALGGAADKYGELKGAAGEAGTALQEAAGGIDATATAAGDANAELARYVALLNGLGSGSTIPTPSLPTPGRQFASGGYTGDFGTGVAAGIVHGQEYVFDAQSTARIGVPMLDAMRRGVKGYAAGGFVGGAGYFPPSPAAGGSLVANTASDFQLLRGSLHEFLTSLANGKALLSSLGGVISSVSQRFLDLAFKSLDNYLFTGSSSGNGAGGLLGIISGLFGGGGSNYFPPAPVMGGLYHGGGTVGAFASSFKRVAPSVFAGAPRLHGGGVVGLSQGERPIIAMDGEEVGWPGQLAQKYGRGGSTVVNNFNIQTQNPRAFAESKATVARASGRFLGRIGRHS